MAPAFAARDGRSNLSAMPGTWASTVRCTVRICAGDSSAAPTAAKTASIGKSDTKLVKVIDAV
jgi:hypothetical protein